MGLLSIVSTPLFTRGVSQVGFGICFRRPACMRSYYNPELLKELRQRKVPETTARA